MQRQYFIGLWMLLQLCISCQSEWKEMDEPALEEIPVSFKTETETKGTELSNANLNNLGVFVYYTQTDNWQSVQQSITPNYLYNKLVSRENKDGIWTSWSYSPPIYWPKASEKLTFFAYTPANLSTEVLSVSPKTQTGLPSIRYTTDSIIAFHKDLLYAEPLLNKEKKDYVNNPVLFRLKHALTKVVFKGKLIYASGLSQEESIKVKSIQLSKLKKTGTLSFTQEAVPTAQWTQEDKTTIYTTSIEFNGGLYNQPLTDTLSFLSNQTGVQLHLPQIIMPDAELIVNYGLFKKINGYEKEQQAYTKKYKLDTIIKTFDMGKSVSFNLYLGLESPGIINANVGNWNYVDVEGNFIATYLHVARTQIKEVINTRISIPFETDYEGLVYAEWIKKPVSAETPILEIQNKSLIIPALSVSGNYEINLIASGINRIIRLEIY